MTLIRVALGIILLTHGYVLKISTFTIAGTVGYFESIGFPAIVAYLVIAGEILDGLAILIGAFTQLAARLSIPIILVILAVSISLGGAGRYAVDNLA